jgi:hypothetical protein
MDTMAMVSAMMAMQAGNFQQSSVLQLLAPASPAANNAPGIGGNLDISA